jgi:hypothetical protein
MWGLLKTLLLFFDFAKGQKSPIDSFGKSFFSGKVSTNYYAIQLFFT